MLLCAWIRIFRLSIPFLPLCPITLMPHKSWPLGRATSIALLDMLRILSNACLPSSNHPLCRNIKRAPLPIIFLCSTKYTMYSWHYNNYNLHRTLTFDSFCDFLADTMRWFWIRNKTLCIASSRKGNGYRLLAPPARLPFQHSITPKCALSVTFCIIITCFSQKTSSAFQILLLMRVPKNFWRK